MTHRRISKEEALALYDAPLLKLAKIAIARRSTFASHEEVTYHIDRNINYTNECMYRCKFCYFYETDKTKSYFLTNDEIILKTKEAIAVGADQILLQGGITNSKPFGYYVQMIADIRKAFPTIQIHAFSPPEINHFAKLSGKTTAYVIETLIDAGLSSIPGGGAEILCDDVRLRIAPAKGSTEDWLNVMRTAGKKKLKASATMMFGTGETRLQRIEHILRLRELQDEQDIFVAFIPWTYQGAKTNVLTPIPFAVEEYLRTLAISRIMLDNIKNIQASWVTQGLEIASLALHFGANDMGSVMLEENVVKSAGTQYKTNENELIKTIRNAGFSAKLRDFYYNERLK